MLGDFRPIAVAAGLFLALMACEPAAAADAAKPAPARTGAVVLADGAKLYYEECGAGAGVNVVLLHDGLLHAVTWDEVWAPLCARYHVVRYDRRGYGRSDPAHAPFSPEDDLLQVLRHVGMERAIVVGNSSGAGLALDFALARPAMVEGLLLVGPVVHGMPSSTYFLERGARANAPLANQDVKAAAENWSRDAYLVAGAAPEARRRIYDALTQSPQNLTTGGQFEVRPAPPTVRRLSQIAAPTVVVVGDADIADVTAYAGAILAALPIVTFEVWKGAGHMIQLERPAEIVDRLDRFAPLAARPEAHVDLAALRAYAGRYRYGDRSIAISLAAGRLQLALPDFPDKPLFAASPSRFFVRTTGTEFEFQKDAAGKVVQMVIHNAGGGPPINCARL